MAEAYPIYAKALALALPVFYLLILVEFLVDRARGTRTFRLADSVNSISCGGLSIEMTVFFGSTGIVAFGWIVDHAALYRLPAAHWGTWVLAFVLYDFCYYWNHRLSHTVGLLWAAHVVHHQSEEFNLTTALRQPGTAVFTSWIFYVPLAVLGVPVNVFLAVALAHLFYQFWPHTRQIGSLGVLDTLVQTPSNHRVHHAQNEAYLDRNYVGVFLLWDRWFGTFQPEMKEEPCIYGIRGQLRSWNPVWANLDYFWAMAKDSWRTRAWRDKLRVWIAPPRWRPADVAARFPKRPDNPHLDFVKFDPPRDWKLSLYVCLQTAFVALANLAFLANFGSQPAWFNLLCFVYVLTSLVTLGGVLENRAIFCKLEGLRVCVWTLAAVAIERGNGGTAMLSLALVSLLGLWLASRQLARPDLLT